MVDDKTYREYVEILKEELVGAMGCTEPIALAFAGAKIREVLGGVPRRVVAKCSGNMLKNVRCVVIPNSGGMTGIATAVWLGIFGGCVQANMDVLQEVGEEARRLMREQVKAGTCKVEHLASDIPLHIIVEAQTDEHSASLEIRYSHLNITDIIRDGQVVFHKEDAGEYSAENPADRSLLNLPDIKEFADAVNLDDVKSLIEDQIRCNMDIAYEGMAGNFGVGLGRVIKKSYPEGVTSRMKAYTAAASEARMGGCEMPVVINSGSGNQGLACSVPVIVYARENNISRDKLYRALVFSNLLTIYQKNFIGCLSAFCGAVSASCSAGVALTYINGGTLDMLAATIDNTMANIPGILCDGAKVSCAAKIATSLDAAIMSHYMVMNGAYYQAHTGIIQEGADETISSVGYIGRVGMSQTDKELIQILLDS
ncbi:MAG: L-serine ammonia-lyase, iron-sulfur-dependent, subunit alpha [bacterium]|nr:L-serine ammonia-lyase, iron-sulfur-dependent, subunit alpha [bacterium]